MEAQLMSCAGDARVLQRDEVANPALPTSRHLRIKLTAVGINLIDTKRHRNPIYYPDKLSAILGCDEVTHVKVGDGVYFYNGRITDEDVTVASPANISLQNAAALALTCLTTGEALFECADLKQEQSVLIHAAAGGVGHLAVPLANKHKCDTQKPKLALARAAEAHRRIETGNMTGKVMLRMD
ncbi:MAG: hypothetical protein R8K48_00630 [Gallionella sp.]